MAASALLGCDLAAAHQEPKPGSGCAMIAGIF
jgi:hypothetical protein